MSNKHVVLVRTGLAVAWLLSATTFSSSSIAENFASSSGAKGTVAANVTQTRPAGTTASSGNVVTTAGSQASGNSQTQGAASSNSSGHAKANASTAGGTISLTMTANERTSISATGDTKNAAASAGAGGAVGPAQLNVTAQAVATSGPGQMTASASASDGSFAFAAKGVVNSLQTSVPGGVTKLINSGSRTESISCNAGGTCSHARIFDNSVAAGIKIFTNTGAVSAGNARAFLRAFLNVEARAGSVDLSASARSLIWGRGVTLGQEYSASVSAATDAQGRSSIWRTTSTESSDARVNGAGNGLVSARVWVDGGQICASTQVLLHHNHALKTLVKCERANRRQR